MWFHYDYTFDLIVCIKETQFLRIVFCLRLLLTIYILIPVSVSHCGHYVVWTGQMFHTLQIPCMNLIHYAGLCCGKLLVRSMTFS